ncbi:MAG: class I SAM-dependent methyltransferase [Planctomycetes bacterium]|nr:class I SAM-dependent methyltransferase [Planctomycetota bacterium]
MREAKAFYSGPGLNVETYDERTALAGTAVEGDVEFYLAQAREAGGAILELGSGTGRVSLALARAGFEVVGLDRSEAMIARAEEKSASLPAPDRARVQFVRGDMSDFDLGRAFGLVLVPFRAFQALLSPEAQRRSLARVLQHLAPGGRLVLDLFDPRLEYCLPDEHRSRMERESVVHPANGHRVTVTVIQRTNDPLNQILSERWRFEEIDLDRRQVRVEEEKLVLRWTYRWEARYLLELSGFEVLAEYSDFRHSPPAYGLEQVWVARRT